MFKWLFSWVRGLFRKESAASGARKAKARAPKEHTGSHYYLGDLLDTLDAAFENMRLARRVDPESHAYFSRVGVSVFNSDMLIEGTLAPHIDLDDPPATGSVIVPGGHDDDEWASMRLGWFMREKRPVNVQPSNRPVYRVCRVFAPKWTNGKPVAEYGYVALNNDGTVSPLKQCAPYRQPGGRGDILRMAWINPWDGVGAERGETDSVYLTRLFALIVNASESSESGLTVRVSSGSATMRFAINMLRTPYFFADRDRTVNHNGRTKRIFHIVRGHERIGAGGQKKWIKTHFRGLRQFEWNGYQVSIGLAGKHFTSMTDWRTGVIDERETNGAKLLSLGEAGDKIANAMERA